MEDPLVLFGRAVGCPVRLELLRALGDQGMTVTEAANSVGVAVSTAFFHLRVLTEAGLVMKRGRRRGGRYVWPRQTWDLVRRDRGEKSNQLNLEPV
jgi:DNA-binding transcriptional ArsR family regulator